MYLPWLEEQKNEPKSPEPVQLPLYIEEVPPVVVESPQEEEKEQRGVEIIQIL